MSWWKMYGRAALPGAGMTNVTPRQRALVNAEILGQSSRRSACSRKEEGPAGTDLTCAKQIPQLPNRRREHPQLLMTLISSVRLPRGTLRYANTQQIPRCVFSLFRGWHTRLMTE